MVTQEYINGTPEIKTILSRLKAIPGVLEVFAFPVTDENILKSAHSESIMFVTHVARRLPDTNGIYIEVNPVVDMQKIGFAMPPSVYLDTKDGHDGIVNVMSAKISKYMLTGVVDLAKSQVNM